MCFTGKLILEVYIQNKVTSPSKTTASPVMNKTYSTDIKKKNPTKSFSLCSSKAKLTGLEFNDYILKLRNCIQFEIIIISKQ